MSAKNEKRVGRYDLITPMLPCKDEILATAAGSDHTILYVLAVATAAMTASPSAFALYSAIRRALARAASTMVNILNNLSLIFWCSKIGTPP